MHEALAVVFATGSAYRKLGLPDEERLSGYGVSWCATCDGFFFRKKTIAVVGGGDSAMEEATFLTKFADKVYVIHRKDELRASKAMQERAFSDPKIEFVWNKAVTGITGSELVDGIDLTDTVDGSTSHLDVSGLFIAIGADPRTHLVHGQLDINADGTVAVDGRSSRTNITGVFAAGDVIDPTYRQAVTAAGSGTVAALDAEHYLASLPRELVASAVQPARVSETPTLKSSSSIQKTPSWSTSGRNGAARVAPLVRSWTRSPARTPTRSRSSSSTSTTTPKWP